MSGFQQIGIPNAPPAQVLQRYVDIVMAACETSDDSDLVEEIPPHTRQQVLARIAFFKRLDALETEPLDGFARDLVRTVRMNGLAGLGEDPVLADRFGQHNIEENVAEFLEAILDQRPVIPTPGAPEPSRRSPEIDAPLPLNLGLGTSSQTVPAFVRSAVFTTQVACLRSCFP
jgi:hypothetical protein